VVRSNKSERNLKDETHYPYSRNTRVMKRNTSKNRAKINRLLKANGEYNKMHKSTTVSNDSSLTFSLPCVRAERQAEFSKRKQQTLLTP